MIERDRGAVKARAGDGGREGWSMWSEGGREEVREGGREGGMEEWRIEGRGD